MGRRPNCASEPVRTISRHPLRARERAPNLVAWLEERGVIVVDPPALHKFAALGIGQ